MRGVRYFFLLLLVLLLMAPKPGWSAKEAAGPAGEEAATAAEASAQGEAKGGPSEGKDIKASRGAR